MFFQPPDDKDKQPQSQPTKSRKRSRRKGKRKASLANNLKNFKKKNGFVDTMSAWAESFTVAATWQLKHQLAYWKARAKSLEYENNVLHDVIRKNCFKSFPTTCETDQAEAHVQYGSSQQNHENLSVSPESEEELESNDDNMTLEENSEDEELEVSEEWIEFLKQNAKYKEEARLERERLKAKMAEISVTDQLEAGPSGPPKNKTEELQELYGEKWKRIAAIEMSVQSQFISNSDRSKPMYWPNIPFNFS
ncbi:gem-associated protein 8-like [Pectinophora gossypiella]|nr:gem-associated protein 8-like [Pectinophora gossypiella]